MSNDGDLKKMSMHDFVVFMFLLGIIASLGSFVIIRLIRMVTMTQEESATSSSADMVEMQNLLRERDWRGTDSRFSGGC